jgi:predicted membrane-bound dolichyl-phosphate-mannose-protein mannosyltransferase
MYWLTGILGVFLIIAPFVLGYSGDLIAVWSSIVLGAIVLIVSFVKAFMHDMGQWEYWVTGIVGLLAIVAPFALGFRTQPQPLDASVILGAVMLLIAGYQLLTERTHAS